MGLLEESEALCKMGMKIGSFMEVTETSIILGIYLEKPLVIMWGKGRL